MTRRFTEAQLSEVNERVGMECIKRDDWRHGTKDTLVFPFEGRHWMVTIHVHHDEGWQLSGDVEAREVRPVQKTITAWEPVPDEEAK